MSAGLKVARQFSLPDTFQTDASAILANRGAGKSNLGADIVEEAVDKGLPVVIFDPKGDYYGLRASGEDGSEPGLDLPIFGGLHGDFELEMTERAGQVLAQLIAETRLSCLIDVSEFDEDERLPFAVAFFDTLYKLNRSPLLVIIEEAEEVVPQVPGSSTDKYIKELRQKLIRVVARIVKLGRQRGLGCLIISQRAADVSKKVLSQVDWLIVMRTILPGDRDTIERWFKGQTTNEAAVQSLPTLKDGEAWFFGPKYGILERHQTRRRRTFDSGATPVHGAAPAPLKMAEIDLGALRAQLEDSFERAEEYDVDALRDRLTQQEETIRQLRVELANRPAEKVTTYVAARTMSDDDLTDLHDAINGIGESASRLLSATARLDATFGEIRHAQETADPVPAGVLVAANGRETAPPERVTAPPERVPAQPTSGSAPPDREYLGVGQLSRPQMKMLKALATFHPRRLNEMQWAAQAELSQKSSAWAPNRKALIDGAYVELHGETITSGTFAVTEVGLDTAGVDGALPKTFDAQVTWWRPKFERQSQAFLDVLAVEHGHPLSRAELAARAVRPDGGVGYSTTSSSFVPSIRALVDAGIVLDDRQGVRLNMDAFA